MNNDKLNQLFAAARAGQPPTPPEGFAQDTLLALRQESARPATAPQAAGLSDELNRLFPRLATIACILVAVCIGGDLAAGTSLSDEVIRVTTHWVLMPI